MDALRSALGRINRFAVFVSLLLTVALGCQDSGAEMQTISNLKGIAIAMHAYHDKYKHLPPAYVLGPDNKPAHSWRVLLLEFLGEESLLSEYSFAEPWNGPNNSKLASRMPKLYRVPSSTSRGEYLTSYVVLVGPKTSFPGPKGVRLKDITNGPENTILVAEAEGFRINWMEPRDWDVEKNPVVISDIKTPGFSTYNRRGPRIALADTKVICLKRSAPPLELYKMSTIDGNEKIDFSLVEAD